MIPLRSEVNIEDVWALGCSPKRTLPNRVITGILHFVGLRLEGKGGERRLARHPSLALR